MTAGQTQQTQQEQQTAQQTAQAKRRPDRRGALLEASGLHLDTPAGRPLVRDLNLSVTRERVALIGRNGVGKSTLLAVLAGRTPPLRGEVVCRTEPILVAQESGSIQPVLANLRERAMADQRFAADLHRECRGVGLSPLPVLAERAHLSRGEARKLHLLAARLARPELLLLDEPTEDLDETGLDWLHRWLRGWRQGLVVVSHDRRLLGLFQHFFVIAESGCRYLPGTFADLRRSLERADADRQRQYVRNLNVLAEREQHNERVCRRRRRKKNLGRIHEERRRTSRARLNEKRSYAQESQARAARIRENRMTAVRSWAKATRRALSVTLPLELVMPQLPEHDGRAVIALEQVSARVGPRRLFADIDLRIGRDRIAVRGPNGAGKTTLLGIMLGQRTPASGSVVRQSARIGAIAQGGTDWMSPDSLLTHLADITSTAGTAETCSPDDLARLLIAHKFPLALAERPLASLSPGERVRAALICLFQRAPAMDVLVLDEPTYSLDFVGVDALQAALQAWPGGLVVASHDRDFLASLGTTQQVLLDGRGGHSLIA